MINKILLKVFIALVAITFVGTSSIAAYVKPPVNKQARTAELETIFDSKVLSKVKVNPNEYLVWVDLTKQRMSIFQSNEFVTSYQILSGKTTTPTPPGTYKVNARIFRPDDNYNLYSAKGDITAKVSYWIPFIGNLYAFHNASWRQFNEFGNTKLRPLRGSHGCINMSYADVEDFYTNYATKGLVVHITK